MNIKKQVYESIFLWPPISVHLEASRSPSSHCSCLCLLLSCSLLLSCKVLCMLCKVHMYFTLFFLLQDPFTTLQSSPDLARKFYRSIFPSCFIFSSFFLFLFLVSSVSLLLSRPAPGQPAPSFIRLQCPVFAVTRQPSLSSSQALCTPVGMLFS